MGGGEVLSSAHKELHQPIQIKQKQSWHAERHLVTVLPSFPSLVYFKFTSQATWQLHVSESCPCHFHEFKAFVRAQLIAQKNFEGAEKALSGYWRQVTQRKNTTYRYLSQTHAQFSVPYYFFSNKCNISISQPHADSMGDRHRVSAKCSSRDSTVWAVPW